MPSLQVRELLAPVDDRRAEQAAWELIRGERLLGAARLLGLDALPRD